MCTPMLPFEICPQIARSIAKFVFDPGGWQLYSLKNILSKPCRTQNMVKAWAVQCLQHFCGQAAVCLWLDFEEQLTSVLLLRF